jgi:hypothetical protein
LIGVLILILAIATTADVSQRLPIFLHSVSVESTLDGFGMGHST